MSGAPWAALILGLGRVASSITSIAVDVDPDGQGLKLSLKTAVSLAPAAFLSAEIAMSFAEAEAVGAQLALLDERSAAFMLADGADQAITRAGPRELVGAVAMIRTLMRFQAPAAEAHAHG